MPSPGLREDVLQILRDTLGVSREVCRLTPYISRSRPSSTSLYIWIHMYYSHMRVDRNGLTRGCGRVYQSGRFYGIYKSEVDAWGVINISRWCFERCCSKRKLAHTILTLVRVNRRSCRSRRTLQRYFIKYAGHRPFEWGWRAVGLRSPCLWWWGRLCRRRCAARSCAGAVLLKGGVSRGYTYLHQTTDMHFQPLPPPPSNPRRGFQRFGVLRNFDPGVRTDLG